jgi:hypothetical protein
MRHPRLWELNLGALVGVVVGAIGGLFAVGIAPAIALRDAAQLFVFPTLGMIFWLLGGPIGYFIGGQIGPRLEGILGERRGNYLGGLIGGLVPAASIALWGWYMIEH